MRVLLMQAMSFRGCENWGSGKCEWWNQTFTWTVLDREEVRIIMNEWPERFEFLVGNDEQEDVRKIVGMREERVLVLKYLLEEGRVSVLLRLIGSINDPENIKLCCR